MRFSIVIRRRHELPDQAHRWEFGTKHGLTPNTALVRILLEFELKECDTIYIGLPATGA